jgi:hypothetical protein
MGYQIDKMERTADQPDGAAGKADRNQEKLCFFSLLSYSSSFGRFPLCILFFLSSPTVPEPRLSLCFAQQSMQKLVSKQGQFDKSILVHY